MTQLPDLSRLSHDEKDALILALWAQVQLLTARVTELEAKLGVPPKTPDNSSVPPSKGQKPNRAKAKTVCPLSVEATHSVYVGMSEGIRMVRT